MSAQSQPRLTPEQYLESERAAEFRSEYYCVQIHATAGGSYQHFQIIGSFSGELHAALKKRPCSVGSNDLRLCVSPEGYTYSDVVVICGDPRFADNQKDTLLNPTLIVDVLSPSTEAYDRGFKFTQYRTVESPAWNGDYDERYPPPFAP